MQYFSEHADKVFAILNCKQRKNDDDAMITMPLDTREYTLYQELKTEGQNESAIFQTLFPPKLETPRNKGKVEISVSALNKRQLIVLLTEALGESLTTLTRMSTSDLRTLLLVIKEKGRGSR